MAGHKYLDKDGGISSDIMNAIDVFFSG